MIADFNYIVLWWSLYFLLGIVALPLTLTIFKKFWDKGYIFSKIISVILLTYLVLVLGLFHFLPFTSLSLLGLILLALFLDFLFLRKNYQKFLQLIRSHWKIFLFEEIIFFIILFAWSTIRGFAPDIEGLEKFMDWGFVNSALRSRFMPPVDMWFSGFPINYYYFGHLMVAVLTKLSGISSAITYNLAIASTCALTFLSGFSLSSNLTAVLFKKINYRFVVVAGLFSALLLTFGGNLHSLYKIAKINIQNEGKLVLTRQAITKASSTYWYPDATRFIGFDPDTSDKTIHEFPLYSFVVADLHGHMNDIPNVILFMSLLFALSFSILKTKINWQLIIPSGFLLSVAYMTNAWDFAVYGLLLAVFYFLFFFIKSNFVKAFKFSLLHGLLIIIFWYLFNLPFSLNFTPMVEGLRLSDAHSPFYQLFILYGGFWLIVLPFVIWFLASIFRHQKSKLLHPDIFVFALVTVATLLVIIPEIGYIKDIYVSDYRRANSMFKLVYEAFIIYSLVSGYIFIRLRSYLPLKILFLLVFLSHMIYPYFAIKSFYNLKQYQGLWGLNYLKTSYPDNFLAISWLNNNVSGQPVVLEAAGDSYTTYNQVSSTTGLPTVQGWIVHEWLWRGGYDQPAARQSDVVNIYEAVDPLVARSLLQKYSVSYVFVGDKEREKYPNLNEDIFSQLGARVVLNPVKPASINSKPQALYSKYFMRDDILTGLNPAQKQAVTHQGSPLLLLAGAGSGKTKVLTQRAAYFIKSGLATPSQILLLTFTNKAANEMKDRLLKLLSSKSYDLRSNSFFAGTFHSFCCRVLRRDGKAVGVHPDFVIYDTGDQEGLIKNILYDLDLSPKEFKPSSVAYYIEDCKNKFISPKDAEIQSSGYWQNNVAKIYQKYQVKLAEYRALDFNDLLFKTVELFIQHPDILEKYQDIYRYILVDEYQDTNQIQYLLTKLLAAKYRQITAVGDASQAIYGWRGADYRNLVSFSTDFKDTTIINLEQNYRSTQIILDAANAVISQNFSHPILKLFTVKKSTDLIKIFEAGSEVEEAEYISQKILFIQENHRIPYRQIAVLYRMNAQSRILEEAFLKYGIPYVLVGGLRFYERAEVKDVLSMLRFAHDRHDHLSELRLEKALGKRRKLTFVQHLDQNNFKKLSSTQILESLITASGYLNKFDPHDEDDQKRIENIKELKSVATSFPKINDFLENIALVQQEYSLQEKNKKKENRDGVRLMTLHGSKGLEFEAVFLVGFEEGILPHSRSMIEESEIEEERRLCYVGITRAKDYLYISYAVKRLFFGKSSLNEPSRFLLDIPDNLLEFDKPQNTIRDYRLKNNSAQQDDSDLVYDPDIY